MSILKKLSHMLNENPSVKVPKPEGEKLAAAVLMVEVVAHLTVLLQDQLDQHQITVLQHLAQQALVQVKHQEQ